MNRFAHAVFVGLLMVALLSGAGSDSRADVYAESDGQTVYVLVLGITEGPDPIPQGWETLDDFDAGMIPDPGPAGPGATQSVAKYATDKPMLIWSHPARGGHDIVFTQWTVDRWDVPQFLAAGPPDELDPWAFTPGDGSVHVVWWVPATDHVFHLSGTNGVWNSPQPVTDDGRRPSVASWLGALLVAYERDPRARGRQIVLATQGAHGVYPAEVIATTGRQDRLDVELHAEHGHLWMDWKHSDTEFAFTEWLAGAWSAPRTVPWDDPSWEGAQESRSRIRHLILIP